MLSLAFIVPEVGLNPVRTLLITAELLRVTDAAPGPLAVASPVNAVI